MQIFAWLLIIFIALVAAVIVAFYFEKKGKVNIPEALNVSLFLVMMPKHEAVSGEGGQPDEKSLITRMEQVFTNFLYIKNVDSRAKESPRITLEIASQIGNEDISFYVAVPGHLGSALEKYIHGVFPRALVEAVPQDYTVFEPGGKTVGSYLKLRENSIFPINTYKNLERDPLSAITNALNKINANEGAAMQVIIRPVANDKWRRVGEKVLEEMQEGKTAKNAIAIVVGGKVIKEVNRGVSEMLNPKSKDRNQTDSKKKEQVIDQRSFDSIQSKIQKQAFETNIRLVASAQTGQRAEEILSHLEGAFGQFALSSVNSLEPIRVKKGESSKFVYDFSFRNFNASHSSILNIEELTSIYHFPTHFTETPYIKSTKSAASAPPQDLPESGSNLIGKVLFRGEEKKVYLAGPDDRGRHFYIVGQTGTGKSSLLREMIRQDIKNGHGVAVIDPHGDLIEHTLANIPKERAEDVILFEPSDIERPVGLNMLEYDTPEQKDFAIQEMIAIFYKLFPPEMIGPMFEHYMRNAMLALMADQQNPGTLVEIPKMFTDALFMEERLKKVTDPVVRDFWLKEWKQTTGSTRSDMLGYVVSKIGRFIENEMMRNVIGQSKSGFNLSDIMNSKKIFLVNLSKGLTGEVNSSLLGLILVSKIQMAAMARARISQEQRKDFYLYIDEFQNFTADSIATILSEARKYRLGLILAHQYMPQLTPEIKNAVLGNVGTIASFRIGAEDAEFLEKQFSPEFSRFDLVNLDNFNLVVKMMINNKISTPFKLEIYKPQEGNAQIAEPIRKLSRLKFGREKKEVEAEIAKRSATLTV